MKQQREGGNVQQSVNMQDDKAAQSGQRKPETSESDTLMGSRQRRYKMDSEMMQDMGYPMSQTKRSKINDSANDFMMQKTKNSKQRSPRTE